MKEFRLFYRQDEERRAIIKPNIKTIKPMYHVLLEDGSDNCADFEFLQEALDWITEVAQDHSEPECVEDIVKVIYGEEIPVEVTSKKTISVVRRRPYGKKIT